ncbi:MAG: hypothetical protein EOO17_04135 [Chloroflexi bacterium]|nr:MAG: hypothetical protein EOO17_04135 [Chloroflexota bacterium]
MPYNAELDIEELADKYNVEFSSEMHESKDYIECMVNKGGIDLDVVATRFGEDYFSYSLSSSHLPRELYPDTIKTAGFSEKNRNDEILQNLRKILSKQVKFYSKPSLLNKKRGYILLTVDGIETKIFQKSNSMDLDVAI